MIRKLRTCLYLLSATFVLISCSQKSNERVKIATSIAGGKNQKVEIVTCDMLNLDNILLSETELDSSGNAILEFDLAQPVFVYIKSGNKFVPIYLSPGDNIKVSMNAASENTDIKYYGDAADVNEYLSGSLKIRQKYETLDGKQSTELEPARFHSLRDSLANGYEKLLKNLKGKSDLPKETEVLLIAKNKMSLLFFQQNYTLANYGAKKGNPDVPEFIRAAIDNIPFDTLALQANISDYGFVIAYYLQSDIYAPLYDKYNGTNPDSLTSMIPLLADKYINERDYPKQIKELLTAKNIDYYINLSGITPGLDAIYSHFKKGANNSGYVSTLKKNYDKWLTIAPGKSAPNFTGVTSEGKKISLSDLKGKVVYIDVWATWCVPCKEEFPHSKKVEKYFEGNDKVAFLFVSIDQNVQAWQKMLADGKIPEGVHVNQAQNKQPDAILESYHIGGIPRYILIDAAGKIVQTHASRPSSGKVQQQIEKLLNQIKLTVL